MICLRSSLWLSLALWASASVAVAQPRTVAITIDDLPVAQSGAEACAVEYLEPHTRQLLQPFIERKVPLTAFVIGGKCPDLSPQDRSRIFEMWREAEAEIGNHSYSHESFSRTPAAEYEADILRADEALREFTGKPLRYFRSPMLHTGATPDDRDRLQAFLPRHGYRQAPVTFDNADWMFSFLLAYAISKGDRELEKRIEDAYVPYIESVVAFFEKRSVEVIGREPAQIHLMHSNVLNARKSNELLAMFERRGYRFISLEEALKDPAYQLPNDYAQPNGISWLHRWSMTKGMPNSGEPDPPAWLTDLYDETQR